MKTLLKTLVATLVFTTGVAIADDAPRQLYAPIDRIYTVEEARELSFYKYLLEQGVPATELDQPNAFVQTYSDTAWGMHKFHRTSYVKPELRNNIQIGTIVGGDRYTHRTVITYVVPRDIAEAYDCVDHNNFLNGIAGCIEDVILKIKAVPKP